MKKHLHIFKNFALLLILMVTASAVNAANKVASATGLWSNTLTWGGTGAPAAGDVITINAGVVVTFDATISVASLTVNGTLTFGNSATARSLTVTGNVIVASTGIINVSNNTVTHSFVLGGNLSNAGSIDLALDANSLCNATFNGTANQTISGAGATTEFNLITLNNTGAANNNIIEITSTVFTVPAGFLSITDGVFKLSGSFAFTNVLFPIAGYAIPAAGGIWLNNTNAVVTGQNSDVTLNGSLRVTAGTYNVGNAAGDDLRYDNGSSLTVDGGNLIVAGAYSGVTAVPTETTTFNMSSGTMTISTVADGNTSNSRSSFDMRIAGSSFTMSGGSIVIEATNSGTAGDYRNLAGTVNITGGTLQFGNATTGTADDNFLLVGTGPYVMPNLAIVDNATSVPTLTLTTGGLTVRGNVTINAGTSLLATGFPISITGNWTNNGTFTPGTQTTTFNGTAAQSIGGANTTAFNAITFNNTLAGVAITVSKLATISGLATFTDGIVSTDATNYLSFLDNATVGGAGLSQATDASFVVGPVRKTGDDAFVFPVGALVTASGGGYMPLTITAPNELGDAFSCEYTRNNATAVQTNGFTSPILNVSRCDYWNLNEVADPSNNNSISVTLSWDGGSPCNANSFITNISALTVAHYNSGTSKWEQAGTGNIAATGNTTAGTVGRSGVSVFSPFSLGNTLQGANPLPVTFFDVKAFEKNSGVQVEWMNLTEKDLANYSVERSVNGRDFTAISTLAARSNQNDAQSYNNFDASPFAGTSFYRIKAVEVDGKISYSKLLKVEIGKTQKGIALYPNPVTGSDLTIGFTAVKGQYTLGVVNSVGQKVFTQTLSHQGGTISQSISLPASVKPGMYTMLLTGDNYRETKIFVIQ